MVFGCQCQTEGIDYGFAHFSLKFEQIREAAIVAIAPTHDLGTWTQDTEGHSDSVS